MLSTITPYRCAKCGSGNIAPYAGEKRLFPSLLNFMKAQTITEYRCPECGSVLPYSMNAQDKAAVDSMIAIGGEQTQAAAKYMKKYKNLEIDPVMRMAILDR